MSRSWLLPALIVGLGLLASGCSAIAELTGGGNVFSLEVGDCFDDGDGQEVSDVPIVECSEPHDNQVFHIFEAPDGAYPGAESLVGTARETCLPEFEEYVGATYADSRLDFFPLYPTRTGWEDGDDREIICSLYDLELEQLGSSMHDSGE